MKLLEREWLDGTMNAIYTKILITLASLTVFRFPTDTHRNAGVQCNKTERAAGLFAHLSPHHI